MAKKEDKKDDIKEESVKDEKQDKKTKEVKEAKKKPKKETSKPKKSKTNSKKKNSNEPKMPLEFLAAHAGLNDSELYIIMIHSGLTKDELITNSQLMDLKEKYI